MLGLAGIESSSADVPPRFASWYPLLACSPEYVAIKTAAELGAEVVFIDLPHHAQIEPRPKTAPVEDAAPMLPEPAAAHVVEREDDRAIVESGFYQQLAESAGYRSWDEAWDSLFEARDFGGDHALFRRELATFCAAARATSSPDRIAGDGTLPRERFMLRTIRRELEARKLAPADAMVVCGGFHLFLDRDDQVPPPDPPAGTLYTTVVPYSFFRISELSGYGAGNRAPQFYELGFELARQGRSDDLLIEHVVRVLTHGRREGDVLSSADAISVCEHARLLARLRGRPQPILDDIHDALVTCCLKGNPEQVGHKLFQAMDAAGIGTRIGRVTPALGRLPLVGDFHDQLAALDLGEVLGKEKRMLLDLDKREDLAAKRSVFCHRVRYLELPLAELVDAPATELSGGRIFREKWRLKWSPGVEDALVEKSLYGDTVEAAVIAKLEAELGADEQHAGRTCARLVRAIDMDLPNLIREVEDACSKAIDADTRFASLSEALGHLLVIERYATFRNLSRGLLGDLIERSYDRACFAIPDVASVPDTQHREVVAGLTTLAEVVQRADHDALDRALFIEHVRAAAETSAVPFLRGVLLGLLAELRELAPEELAGELLALARAPTDVMVSAGDFLDGVLAVSRASILVGADALVLALDELLKNAEWQAFLVMLPRLRAAFERLHERQRDAFAGRVATRYGLKEEETLTVLGASVTATAYFADVDRRVAAIMKDWGL